VSQILPEHESSGGASPRVEDTEPTGSGSGLTEDEFRAAYERHAVEILRYAIRCTGRREIAEELASEAFLKMYQHRGSISPSQAAAWLTTTVKNLATDRWRRMEVERRYRPVQPTLHAEAQSELRWDEMLRHPALKAEHRACLTLRFVHGMDRKEICSQTGLTDNQVKNCLQYGLKLLRDVYGVKE
jgi:RNA polymerase sigma-70 factor (ECF subfamily)